MKLTAKSPKKSKSARKPRRTHVENRHPPNTVPPSEPPLTALASAPMTRLDPEPIARIAALKERGKRLELLAVDDWNTLAAELAKHPHRLTLVLRVARATAAGDGRLATHEEDELANLFGEWTALGASLLALPNGAHRVALAMRTARAAASGGIEIGAGEARAMEQWLADTIDLAIARGGENAASAIWYVITGDWQPEPSAIRPARCPAVARIEVGPGEQGSSRRCGPKRPCTSEPW